MTRVIDACELSPLQAGMLFHALGGAGPGVEIEQVIATLCERLDGGAFLRAWERLLERQSMLRTRCRWEGLAEPLQEGGDRVELPARRLDWRQLTDAERRARFEALVAAERQRGFDLHLAPIMRLVLVRVADCEHWVLWTVHHILFDGRSRLRVWQELFAYYE